MGAKVQTPNAGKDTSMLPIMSLGGMALGGMVGGPVGAAAGSALGGAVAGSGSLGGMASSVGEAALKKPKTSDTPVQAAPTTELPEAAPDANQNPQAYQADPNMSPMQRALARAQNLNKFGQP